MNFEWESGYEGVLEWLRSSIGFSPAEEADARALAARQQMPLPLALNASGIVPDSALQDAFVAVTGLSKAPAHSHGLMMSGISADFLRARRVAVLSVEGDAIDLGMVDPLDEEALAGVAFATGLAVNPLVMRVSDQKRLHASLYESGDAIALKADIAAPSDALGSAMEFSRESPIARLVTQWIVDAVKRRASDIHIEPRKNALFVRYRIDGVMLVVAEEPLNIASSVMARIKVLADLDLGERRIPQDGRSTAIVEGRPVDLRVSLVPSVQGESAVIRLLDRTEVRLDLDALGLAPHTQAMLQRVAGWPDGLFVVTGPTGSGKTTTLYAIIELMREMRRKILSIEDPVEFSFEHVTQLQVSQKSGLTFASAIRSFLRQDPDVILVGEIRDTETARTAVQAALTGHLVLATLHAIDAERAVPRLIDMGVEPFQLAACFKGAMSQRLVRRLCPECRIGRPPSDAERLAFSLDTQQVFDPSGCVSCGHTGYSGRIAISEAFEADEQFAQSLLAGVTAGDISRRLLDARISDDASNRVAAGLTSPLEIARAMSA